MTPSDRNRLYELEERVRLLDRRDRHLNVVRQSWVQKVMSAVRPFEMIGGVALTMLGLLIFVSLLITKCVVLAHWWTISASEKRWSV